MNNKVLINIVVPSLMEHFEIYIPINERVSKVKELIINLVYDLSDDSFDKTLPYGLIDIDTYSGWEQTIPDQDTAKTLSWFLYLDVTNRTGQG